MTADESSDPIEAAWQEARTTYPGVDVPRDRYAAYLAARRPPDVSLADQLATWCTADLYLACACIAGDREAIALFERTFMPFVDAVLHTWEPAVAEETRQRLRAQLLVDHASRGPLLAKFDGRGALRRWIRVVTAREAGKVKLTDAGLVQIDDDELFDVLAPPTDPRISAIKRDAAVAFKAAFVVALGELERRERTVLRMHVLDGLTMDEIAPVFGAHRATVARWIASAKQTVLDRTRRKLMEDLRLDRDAVDSLIALVQSRIELTDQFLLQSRP